MQLETVEPPHGAFAQCARLEEQQEVKTGLGLPLDEAVVGQLAQSHRAYLAYCPIRPICPIGLIAPKLWLQKNRPPEVLLEGTAT